MPVLEPLVGLRVVAEPRALDGARWRGADVTVLRFAPDDAFAIGAEGVGVDDLGAIVEPEVGFVGAWFRMIDLLPHVEWELPSDRPVLVQGFAATVPAKLWLPDGFEAVFLLTAAAYADELDGRLRTHAPGPEAFMRRHR